MSDINAPTLSTTSGPAAASAFAKEQQTGRAWLPATCGELVQGSLDGIPCLVSCPITLWSQAEVALDASKATWQIPDDTPKAGQAVRAALAAMPEVAGGALSIKSPIPRGRGYGSSTADIAAALYALGDALGRPMLAVQVARLAVAVEPSDSTMFDGITLFDHRQARFHETLGRAPALAVAVLDPGGEVDTVAFNQRDLAAGLRPLASQHRRAFDLLRQGLATADVSSIGAAATLSAQAQQSILHNPLLEVALALARSVGALGVCRAHSGTILGILLDPARIDAADVLAHLRHRVGRGVGVVAYHLTDGGPRYSTPITPMRSSL